MSKVMASEKYAYSTVAYVKRYGIVTIGAKTLILPIIMNMNVTIENRINALTGTEFNSKHYSFAMYGQKINLYWVHVLLPIFSLWV